MAALDTELPVCLPSQAVLEPTHELKVTLVGANEDVIVRVVVDGSVISDLSFFNRQPSLKLGASIRASAEDERLCSFSNVTAS
jgi:hypothetical protein